MDRSSFRGGRREFLRRLGRYAAGAGVAVLAAVLLGRNGDATARPTCAGNGRCRRCGLARTCALPQAEALRRRAEREGHDV